MKQWLYRGKVPAMKTPGGHYRIEESDLDSLMQESPGPQRERGELMRTVSGRNQLTGRVVELKFDGLLAQVKLSIGGQVLTSIITADAARELRLTVGETAIALIKSTEVMVIRI